MVGWNFPSNGGGAIKSTLLMLVSALAGREFILQAYREAVEQRYRFFSFGDAMFITHKEL